MTDPELAVLAAVDRGWVMVAGRDLLGRDVYRLTEAGRRRAEELLGLAVGELDRWEISAPLKRCP